MTSTTWSRWPAGPTTAPERWAWPSTAAPCQERTGHCSPSTRAPWISVWASTVSQACPATACPPRPTWPNSWSPECSPRSLLAQRDRIAVILNGLGRTKYEELFVVWKTAAALLAEAGYTVVQPEVGELVTSLDMAGCSLTVMWLDDELERLWTAPTDTPAYRKGGITATDARIRTVVTAQAHHAQIDQADTGGAASGAHCRQGDFGDCRADGCRRGRARPHRRGGRRRRSRAWTWSRAPAPPTLPRPAVVARAAAPDRCCPRPATHGPPRPAEPPACCGVRR